MTTSQLEGHHSRLLLCAIAVLLVMPAVAAAQPGQPQVVSSQGSSDDVGLVMDHRPVVFLVDGDLGHREISLA